MTAIRWLSLAALAAAVGCSGGAGRSAGPSAGAEEARSALFAALDAWKKGQPKALSDRDPPVRFVDDDFAAGMRLTGYAIQEPDRPIAPDEDIPVTLSLRDARGKSIRRVAAYRVSTSPAPTVERSGR
ncbi:hypothetical protein OJF2_45100 [Aquisphaera giovannonii]|uniref:Uncharacterized protein n=1 Tax=Aquisphaera giovannonii TaxID=406548 RepID=A0A5B9W5S2_9BACT|nr:hypothetical protein [Aquisphaera giovannonii]QEH35953.1 hypothetical protein OJF2_45100 [Aquisphaera giovannonii]